MTAVIEANTSRESRLDRQLEELAAKVVQKNATAADWSKFQELAQERARLMTPPFRAKILRMKAAAG